MNAQMTAYVGVVIGTLFLAIHLVYGYRKTKKSPPLLRLLSSLLAGSGLATAAQIGTPVLAPPSGTTISVDENRMALAIAAIAVIAIALQALWDNARAVEEPQASAKSDISDQNP